MRQRQHGFIGFHSMACWGMGGSVIAADCGSKIRLFSQWAAANCAAPPSVIGGQYATLYCKPLMVRVSL